MARYRDQAGNIVEVDDDGNVQPVNTDNRISLGIPGTPLVTPDFQVPQGVADAVINLGSIGDRHAQSLGQLFGAVSPEEGQLREQDRAAMEAATRASSPVAARLGGNLDMVASMLPAGRGAQIGLGAVEGAMRPADSVTERVSNAVMGAGLAGVGDVAGQAVGSMAGRVTGAISSMAGNVLGALPGAGRSATAALVNQADQFGLKLTPGQRAGSEGLRMYEAGFAGKPWLRNIMDDIGSHNQEMVNRYFAKAIGASDEMLGPGGQLTEGALGDAMARNSALFQSVGDAVPEIKLSNHVKEYLLGNSDIKKIRAATPDVFARLDDGVIEGREFMDLRSALQKYAEAQSSDRVGRAVRSVVDQLDDQVGRAAETVSPGIMADYAKAREQYRLQTLIPKLGVLDRAGDVSPGILANRMQQLIGPDWMTGNLGRYQPETAEFVKLIKLANHPGLKPVIGSSGTAERAGVMETISRLGRGITSGDYGDLASIPAEQTIGRMYRELGDSNPQLLERLVNDPAGWFSEAGRAAGRTSTQQDR